MSHSNDKPGEKPKDSLLFEKSKLVIVTKLAASAEALSFTELLEQTDLTNGNLSSHLKKLEENEYVKIEKQFVGKRPLTTVQLTKEGRKQLKDYVTYLKQILETVSKLD